LTQLRSTLDPDSQILYDEVTTKYLLESRRQGTQGIQAVDRLVARKLAEERFCAFVRSLQVSKGRSAESVSRLLADPEFRLIAWQQVRQWAYERENGIWESREQEAKKRYHRSAVGVRVFYGLAAALILYSVVINEFGLAAWIGLFAVLVGTGLLMSLPGPTLNYSIWRVHIEALKSQSDSKTSDD